MFYPVLKSENEILNILRKNLPPCSKDLLCFFSSHLGAFITDPLFMNISLEDKMIHRGYAVFDTAKIFENKVYQLDNHVNRFLESIEYINLKPKYKKTEIKDILMKMSSISREAEPVNDLELRFFYSAGLGNFSVTVNDDLHSFYAYCLRVNHSIRPITGVNEVLVNITEIKENIIHAKNTNYLVNSIVTKTAKEKGGYLGIMIDEFGNLLESPISNIAFVLKTGEFCVPTFEKTLAGTTIIRCFDYINEVLIPKGLIKEIKREYVNMKEIPLIVKEAMLVGGDHILPILKLDEYKIGEGPGEIAKLLQDYLVNDRTKEIITEEIPPNDTILI
jgi:branched-subunit amino acid aminotransferase/4-amino-4-deoxychorismate lyase